VSTTEITLSALVPPGSAADYVDGSTGSGEVRVRVRSTRSTNFTSQGEMMSISYIPF
jgi:hypothetical protein